MHRGIRRLEKHVKQMEDLVDMLNAEAEEPIDE